MATVTIHKMQSHSFTLTSAYKTWDGSVHLDVHHPPFLLKPQLRNNSDCKMIRLVNNSF